jgi:hypothetical protein
MDNTPSRKERRERIRASDRAFEELRAEKRKYTRTQIKGKVDFITCDVCLLKERAIIENVSQFGALFRTKIKPRVGDVLALRFDFDQLFEIVNIDELVRETNGDILANVVRVADHGNNGEYDIAVNFFKKGF